MHLIVVGLNHKTAPVEVREAITFSQEEMGDAFRMLLSLASVSEAVILCTCNRVEIYAVTPEVHAGISEVKFFLSKYHSISPEVLENHLYTYSNEEAVLHLFRVSSSLDSMVIGEPQILGQVKEAYSVACKHRACSAILNKLFHKAFSVAKRIRTETKIGSSAVSISYAAVELAKKIFETLSDKIVMVVGAGEMAELAVKHLINTGIKDVYVTNRTYERAIKLAQEFKGKAIPFDELYTAMRNVDIVITSTGSTSFIIVPEKVREVMRLRKGRSVFFIDIAVPRDIDPSVDAIDNVFLYNIDDLKEVVETNLRERMKEAEKAEQIIAAEVKQFIHWMSVLQVTPTIVSIREKAEEIRKRELEKTLLSLKNLSEEEKRIIELMSASIVNKILHHPVTILKEEAAGRDGNLYIAAARKLFNIDDEAKEGE